MDLNKESEELKRYFSTLDIVGQRAMKKKVHELAYPYMNSMCLPLMKYNAKMGVKKNRKGQESDLHRAPSHWEYIDASQGSLMSKRSFGKALSS